MIYDSLTLLTMSSIHYFQRYSQPENVATNNTLLLLSRLHQDSPNKFKELLNDLLDDSDLTAGVVFNQQEKGVGSVPDGSFSQSSFKVVIETKSHKHFSVQQITDHLKSFGSEEYQILLSLSPNEPDNAVKSEIQKEIAAYNSVSETSIKYIPTTFKTIVEKFNNIIEEYDFELVDIIDDFEDYCIHDGLITDDESRMRVVPCGWTLNENMQYSLYYDSVGRGFSEHTYIGIYKDKAVRGIAKLNNVITADLVNGQLQVIDFRKPPSAQEKQNIIDAIAAAQKINNWNIATGHKFFCVEKFYDTFFEKKTKLALRGTKFFNLKDVLGVQTLPSINDIATELRKHFW
jgi:hypothetical protein